MSTFAKGNKEYMVMFDGVVHSTYYRRTGTMAWTRLRDSNADDLDRAFGTTATTEVEDSQ